MKRSALCFGKLEQCDPPPPKKKNKTKQKTIEFKLRIYEINIVKKREDASVKHRYIDRSKLCCFHLEIKKNINDLTVKSCVGAFKRFTRERTLYFISQ